MTPSRRGVIAGNGNNDPTPRVAFRADRVLPVAKITEPKPGVFVFDFGQNMAGYVELSLRGPAGTAVKKWAILAPNPAPADRDGAMMPQGMPVT